MSEKQFYTVPEAARELDVTEQTIHNWRKANRFPGLMEVGRNYLIPVDDLEAVRLDEARTHVERLHALGFRGVAIPA